MNKKIVIYGGSFNPPHVGHMADVENVLRNFKCDEIWIVPSRDRLDKHIGTPGKHRVQMLKLSIKGFFSNPTVPIKISDMELKRKKMTTTVDTKKELAERYPQNTFYFLIGSELLREIKSTWVRGKELWRSTRFLAIKNPLVNIRFSLPENIRVLDKEVVWLNISSTMVRRLLKEGYSGEPYIHPKVARYIKKNKLYK